MYKDFYREVAERHPGAIYEPYAAFMEQHGFEALYSVCEILGGATVHVPLARGMFAGCMYAEIRREYDGYNIRYLANKYGYTEKHIYRIVGPRKRLKRPS